MVGYKRPRNESYVDQLQAINSLIGNMPRGGFLPILPPPVLPGGRSARSTRTKQTLSRGQVITKTKTKKKKKRKYKSTRKLVKNLIKKERKERSDDTSYTHKLVASSSEINISPSTASYTNFTFGTYVDFELLTTDILRIEDISGTTQVVDHNLGVGSLGQPKIWCSMKCEFKFRNNSGIPVHCDFYEGTYLNASSRNPSTILDNQGDDIGLTNFSTNVHTFPSDTLYLKTINPDITYKNIHSANFNPGDEFDHTMRLRKRYDPDELDRVSNTLPKGAKFLMVRMQGVLAHDKTTPFGINYGDGVMDCMQTLRMKASHIDGMNTNNYLVDVVPNAIVDAVADAPALDEEAAEAG